MNQLLGTVALLASAVIAGRIAGGVGDFLLLVTGSIAIGVALSSLVTYWNEDEPRQWDRAVGYGTMIGFAFGVVLAIIDTLFPS